MKLFREEDSPDLSKGKLGISAFIELSLRRSSVHSVISFLCLLLKCLFATRYWQSVNIWLCDVYECREPANRDVNQCKSIKEAV